MKKNSCDISVKVTLDKARIAELVSAAIKATEDTANFIEKKLVKDQVIPYNQGKLQGSLGVSSSNKGSYYIAFSSDYADELYYSNRVFQTRVNANAQARWMDYLLSSELPAIKNHFISSFKKRGKV